MKKHLTAEAEEKRQAFLLKIDDWVESEIQKGISLDAVTAAWNDVYRQKCRVRRIRHTSQLLVGSSRWPRQLEPQRKIIEETPAGRFRDLVADISSSELKRNYPLFLTAVVHNFEERRMAL